MNRDIDTAVEERLFDLLREKTFAADLGQGPILHLVTGRADNDDFHRNAFMLRQQAVADLFRLDYSQRRSPRANFQDCFHLPSLPGSAGRRKGFSHRFNRFATGNTDHAKNERNSILSGHHRPCR